MNFLETLVAEWYEYSRYFVRTNARTRKRSRGGWDIELDVLAFSPEDQRLIHIETSGDGASWLARRNRFMKKKFILTTQEYEALVGCKIKKVERIAVVGYTASTKQDLNWGNGIKVVLIPELVADITSKLRELLFPKQVVPEGFPLLRAMQIAVAFQKDNRAANASLRAAVFRNEALGHRSFGPDHRSP